MSTRHYRREQADKAYQLQTEAAIRGSIKYTGLGLGLAVLGHYTWPFFRRQTLPFKAFLVSGFTIFGLVVGADSALLSHEADQRIAETALRKEARIELGRRGIVATEGEIAKWKAERVKSQANLNTGAEQS